MTEVKALANKNDVIFQVGLIALGFARLENALDHCLYTIAQEKGVGAEVTGANPMSPFGVKVKLLKEWVPWYMKTCNVRNKFHSLEAILDECKSLARERNRFVHSMALFYEEDFESEDSKRFQFLWKNYRREVFGDWVDATLDTLEEMRLLQNQISTYGDLIQDLSMDLSHADNRIREYEEAMAADPRF